MDLPEGKPLRVAHGPTQTRIGCGKSTVESSLSHLPPCSSVANDVDDL